MKIIDKTPLLDQKGNTTFTARVQGTLKYGLSWYSDLEVQKNVVAQLGRTLEKGFVLIRNFTLPGSDIVIPIILIGQFGIQTISITQAKGFFEAKGDQWNVVSIGRSKPASINLLWRAGQYARALQKYLQFQHIEYPSLVEPVLISANPGAHIESIRPVARVVLSDAIKQFAASLSQARPVLRPEQVYDFAERIVNPISPDAKRPDASEQSFAQPNSPGMGTTATFQKPAEPQPPTSRSQAIFKSEQAPFDPNDMGFAFEDDKQSTSQVVPLHLRESSPAQPLPPQSAKKKIIGMTTAQFALLAIMLIVECCVVIGFVVFISTNQ